MLLPLAICFSRVHRHSVVTPGAVTQEVNRCLTMVRVAASRRSARTTAPVRRTNPITRLT
jgi:hypothetical protein